VAPDGGHADLRVELGDDRGGRRSLGSRDPAVHLATAAYPSPVILMSETKPQAERGEGSLATSARSGWVLFILNSSFEILNSIPWSALHLGSARPDGLNFE
jgi:hypothetical protein